ncbi:MAG: hypothetical protein ACOC8K_08835 [Gemmatimonadota bacterium]
MSLIRIRRNRKKNWLDQKKFFSTRTLVLLLLVAIGIMVYASDLVERFFSSVGTGG